MKKKAINAGIETVQKKGSKIFTESYHMLPALSLMKAAGVIKSLKDKNKSFITVVNSYTTHIPGHTHLQLLGKKLVEQLKKNGFNVWYCNIGGAVDDGIAMGHFGMKYSLPSRELITDQIETVIGAHPCDGWIGIGNCDKIVPGMLNAMVRLNIPSVYVSGGPMLAGQNNTDLVTHNYYVIVGLLISALLLAYFDMKNGVVLFGAMVVHYVFDILDDILMLGHVNPNWRRFGKPGRRERMRSDIMA